MNKGFFDIKHKEPEQIETGNALKDDTQNALERAQDRNEADRLKESITRQLEAGQEPHIILLTAVKAIGLYSGDPEFTTAAAAKIDSVYSDLEQMTFTQDNAAIARERLESMQAAYKDKARKGINRQIRAAIKIEQALLEALHAVDALEPNRETAAEDPALCRKP